MGNLRMEFCDLDHDDGMVALRLDLPCPVNTSTSRSFVDISSRFGHLLAIGAHPFPNYRGGPVHWGRLRSRKARISLQPARDGGTGDPIWCPKKMKTGETSGEDVSAIKYWPGSALPVPSRS